MRKLDLPPGVIRCFFYVEVGTANRKTRHRQPCTRTHMEPAPVVDETLLLHARSAKHAILRSIQQICATSTWTPRCRSQFGRVALYFQNNAYACIAFAVDFLLHLRKTLKISNRDTVVARDFWNSVSNAMRASSATVKDTFNKNNIRSLLLDVSLQITCKTHNNALELSDEHLNVIQNVPTNTGPKLKKLRKVNPEV
jgi:hypothetical protein